MKFDMRLHGFSKEITLFSDQFDWEKRKPRFVERVKETITEIRHSNELAVGGGVQEEIFVPGGNNIIENVPEGGKVIATWDANSTLVQEVYDLLRKLSPLRSGDYIRSHEIWIDDQLSSLAEARQRVGEASKIEFTTRLVYSRRQESNWVYNTARGIKAKSAYHAAYVIARRKYSDFYRVKMHYVKHFNTDPRDTEVRVYPTIRFQRK